MRVFGMMAVGLVASWGTSALADNLPPVKKISTQTLDGCLYSIQSQPHKEAYPYGGEVVMFRITLQRESGPGFCPLPPASRELYDVTTYEPEIAITSGVDGIAAAYGWKDYRRTYGPGYQIKALQVKQYPDDGSSLEISRESTVVADQRSSYGSFEGYGDVHLEKLTLRSGNLEVRGSLTGTWLRVSEGSDDFQYGDSLYEGAHFIALYPRFFSSTQRPVFATY
jgi:hypothetical protein